MVHQIWLGDRREDPTAANYSAEDLVLIQRDIGRLAQYTAEMGATADLLDLVVRALLGLRALPGHARRRDRGGEDACDPDRDRDQDGTDDEGLDEPEAALTRRVPEGG